MNPMIHFIVPSQRQVLQLTSSVNNPFSGVAYSSLATYQILPASPLCAATDMKGNSA